MTSAAEPTARSDMAPGWDIGDLELRCPRCNYDVRGLPQPRCPECGLRFHWLDLIAAAITPNGRLFEQQWRRRPIRSFLATFVVALWPPVLWRRTPLESPPRILPLGMLAGLLLLVYVLELNGLEYIWCWRAGVPFAWSLGDRVSDAGHRTIALAVPIAATWLGLRVFWQTRRHYRIREDQLLRLMVLTWTTLMAWKAVLIAGEWTVCTSAYRQQWWASLCVYLWLWSFDKSIPLLAAIIAVCTGLQSHLRIRRGWSTGLLAMVLALVTLVLAYVHIRVRLGGTILAQCVGDLSLEWEFVVKQIGRILVWVALH